MNSTYNEKLGYDLDIADEDVMIVKTFNDTGYEVSVETDGMSIFGTKAGKELVKNLQNEMQETIDKEILERLKALQ